MSFFAKGKKRLKQRREPGKGKGETVPRIGQAPRWILDGFKKSQLL